jgi:hypothetical protein
MKPSTAQDEPTTYEIRVKGVLDEAWSDWFGGLVIVPQAGGETLLRGPVRDQAALHGLMVKIRDMGLPLLSVNPVEIDLPREEEG